MPDVALTTGESTPAAPYRASSNCLILFLAYYALAVLALFLARYPGSVASFWFANAFAVGWILTTRNPYAPLPWFAVASAVVLANLSFGDSVFIAISFVPANLAEALLAVALVRRFAVAPLRLEVEVSSIASVLICAAAIPPLAGATLGAASLHLLGFTTFATAWPSWLVGDVLGMIVVLPLVLAWRCRRDIDMPVVRRRWMWLVLVPFAVVATLPTVFGAKYPLIYLPLPLLVSAFVGRPLMTFTLCAVTVLMLSVCIGMDMVEPSVNIRAHIHGLIGGLAAVYVPSQLLAVAVANLRVSRASLTSTNARLAVSNDQLRRFARVLAHDLREPINTVNQFSSLIERRHGEGLTPPLDDYFGYINRGARRMANMLDALLTLNRLEEDRAVAVDNVDLDQLMRRVIDALQAQMSAAGASIDLSALPQVKGEPALLEVLFQNLISNAVKFAQGERNPHIHIDAKWNDDWADVRIRDNGIGIPLEQQEAVFDAFIRLHPRSAYDGDGLGLATCKRIVDLHGGAIAIESDGVSGSTFVVRLAVVQAVHERGTDS